MIKRLIMNKIMSMCLFSVSIFLATIAIAERCPSIDEIKNNNLHGWHVYKNDIYTPASKDEISIFQNQAAVFTEVTWMAEGRKGGTTICEYAPVYKSNHIFLGAFEVGTYDEPDPGNSSWKKKAFFFFCSDSVEKCSIK